MAERMLYKKEDCSDGRFSEKYFIFSNFHLGPKKRILESNSENSQKKRKTVHETKDSFLGFYQKKEEVPIAKEIIQEIKNEKQNEIEVVSNLFDGLLFQIQINDENVKNTIQSNSGMLTSSPDHYVVCPPKLDEHEKKNFTGKLVTKRWIVDCFEKNEILRLTSNILYQPIFVQNSRDKKRNGFIFTYFLIFQ
jgi:hypothetical protein